MCAYIYCYMARAGAVCWDITNSPIIIFVKGKEEDESAKDSFPGRQKLQNLLPVCPRSIHQGITQTLTANRVHANNNQRLYKIQNTKYKIQKRDLLTIPLSCQMYDGNSLVVYRNRRLYVALSLTVYCHILIDIIAVFLNLTRATSQLKAVLKFLEENAKKSGKWAQV